MPVYIEVLGPHPHFELDVVPHLNGAAAQCSYPDTQKPEVKAHDDFPFCNFRRPDYNELCSSFLLAFCSGFDDRISMPTKSRLTAGTPVRRVPSQARSEQTIQVIFE